MSESSSARVPPHIRLNSGQDDILTQGSTTVRPPGPLRKDSSRSLIPQRPQTANSIQNQPSNHGLYSRSIAESAERLLPPPRSRTHRFRDEESPVGASASPTGFSSRRTSWSSEGGSRDSRIYSLNPFDDSRAPSRAGSDDDNVNTQTVSEKYNILPSAGLLLFPEDVEKDDWLHNPDPNEKEKRECDIFTKRGFVNVGGLVLLTLGVLTLFIGYPVLYVPNLLDASSECLYHVLITYLQNLRSEIHRACRPMYWES